MSIASPTGLISTFECCYEELLRFATLKIGDADRAFDIVHEAYIRAQIVDKNNETIHNPKAYLFRIVGNIVIDTLRKQSHRQKWEDNSHDELQIADHLPLPDKTVAARQRIKALDEILQDLPEKTRQSLLFSRVNGLTHTQIAARLNLSESMVAKNIAQALRACRDRLRARETESTGIREQPLK